MSAFPRKYLPAPQAISPMPEIINALDNSNSKYNPNRFSWDSWMPDFTRAIKLEEAVYRVNVPGYFWRHPKTSGTLADSTHKSGMVIGRFNFDLDTNYHGLHSWKCCTDTNAPQTVVTFDRWDSNEESCDPPAVPPDFKGTLTWGTTEGIWMTGDVDENGDAKYAKDKHKAWKDPSYAVPTGVIQGHSTDNFFIAAMPMQQYNADSMVGRKRTNYFVCTGNGGGGCANAMIPIIPGINTTNHSYSITVNIGGGVITSGGCSYCSGTVRQTDDSYQSYSINDESIVFETYPVITSVVKHFPKLEDDSDKFKSDEIISDIITGKLVGGFFAAGSTSTDGAASTGILEAKGTYIHFYRETACTDDMFFIPCKSSPAESSIKPLTKIRSCDSSHCNYNMASYSQQLQTITMSAVPVYVYTWACEDDKVTYSGSGFGTGNWRNNGNNTITQDTISFGGSFSGGIAISGCGHVQYGQASGFDKWFRELWVSQSLTGIYGKFVAQQFSSSMTTIGTSMTGSLSSFSGNVTLKAFDPTVDGY